MLDVEALRSEFPALTAAQVFLDGPAGTQVPSRVISAVSEALMRSMSNVGGDFASSRRSDTTVSAARTAASDFVGGRPDEVVFGPNMTSLTFAFSRALAEEWKPGDRIVLSGLDHDANITPWVRAAASVGAETVFADVKDDATLDLDHMLSLIDERTRLVAVTACSNAFGSLVDVSRVTSAARQVGALTYVDAVHFAPHRFIDVNAIGCDFLVASSYKFFGPHLGVLWARRHLLERRPAFKVRPAPDVGPARWETGTPPFELLAGFSAAVDYLASLGWGGDRRGALEAAFREIAAYEASLARKFLDGLPDRVRVVGLTTAEGRVPTFSVEVDGLSAPEVSKQLGARRVAVWAGHYYAVEPMQRLGFLDKGGLTRIGFLHVNTESEVDSVLTALADLS
ncbi:MAG TPA: cysteine desulfurase-like protein [Acidimicrobiia bacterium]|nr:cysteine desulfurase-like protein [Acidimicrobiia bacterium]